MKTRTHHEAARQGAPAEWTCDDAEAARMQANQTARPWGLREPTPEQAWQRRRPIRASDRVAFGAAVRRLEEESRQETVEGPEMGEVARRRIAVARALVEQGLLAYRRERPAAAAGLSRVFASVTPTASGGIIGARFMPKVRTKYLPFRGRDSDKGNID